MAESRASTKAVVEGKLQHVSASQVRTFLLCQRKWWYEKIAGLVAPTTQALATGTAIHAEMEAYYLDGTLPRHPSASRALHALPPRDPSIHIEAPLEDPDLVASGVRFKGFIDWHRPEERSVYIIDWKTTSDFRYAKTEEEVARDIQLGAYAQWATWKYPDIENVRLALVYLKSKNGADYRIVEATVGLDLVSQTWSAIESAVYDMSLVAKRKSAEDVAPNFNACNQFGGCPWRDRCGVSNVTQPSLESRFNMALSDKFKAAVSSVSATPESGSSSVSIVVGTTDAPSIAVGVLPPDAPKPEKPVRKKATKPEVSTELVLYVDCVPVKGETTSTRLEDLIATRANELAAKYGVTDIRITTDRNSPLAFGGWKAVLASSFRDSPPAGNIVAQSGELSSPVIESLIPLASMVVKGVR